MHEDQHGQVRLNSDLSEAFQIANGVKQGCVLAPTLFSIFFSMMLKQAMEGLDGDNAVYIRYSLDDSLFNLRRLQTHTKTLEQLFRDLLFADDAALVAHTESALQRLTSCFAEAAQLFGFEVSLKMTEVLYQPAPRKEYCLPHITIGETVLKTVISSPTWGVQSHQTPRSTGKWTTNWPSQTALSANFPTAYGKTSI